MGSGVNDTMALSLSLLRNLKLISLGYEPRYKFGCNAEKRSGGTRSSVVEVIGIFDGSWIVLFVVVSLVWFGCFRLPGQVQNDETSGRGSTVHSQLLRNNKKDTEEMDLIYEQEAAEKLEDSQETLKAHESNETSEINRKTEESFQKLEDEISKTYTAIETKASTWGASFSSFISNLNVSEVITDAKKQVESLKLDEKLQETKNNITKNLDTIQKKIVTEENKEKSKDMLNLLSQKTNTYLDDLDKDLEQVENFAGTYVSKFGQFLKESIAVSAPDDQDELIEDQEGELLFNVGGIRGPKLSASRTEAQLYTLQTSAELYLTEDKDPQFEEFKQGFKVDSKTDEICQLLKKCDNLQKLSTELVPAKVKYDEFWARYFYMHEKILQQESNRKRLLSEKKKNETKEDLDWGDDEEEDSDKKHEKSANSSEGTYELNSINSSTVEVNKKNKEETNAKEEEDDDDDWE
jgi:hypothetical protein